MKNKPCNAPPATAEERAANEAWAKNVKKAPPQKCTQGQLCNFDRITDPRTLSPAALLKLTLCPEHAERVHAARKK